MKILEIIKRGGSSATPAHDFTSFKFKVYAPYGFKCLRRKINLDEADFMVSIYFWAIYKKENYFFIIFNRMQSAKQNLKIFQILGLVEVFFTKLAMTNTSLKQYSITSVSF